MNKPTATEVRRAIADFAFGTDEEIADEVEAMSLEECEAYLKENGISIEPKPEIKARLDAAREQLRQRIEEEDA